MRLRLPPVTGAPGYDHAAAPLVLRGHAQGQPAFAGFDLVETGLVQVPMWRPDHKALRPSELAKIGR